MRGVAPSDVEALRRILALEQEKGYRNRAVIGGLDRYLRYLEANGSLPASLRPHLAPGYAGLSLGQRQRWVEALLADLPPGDGRPSGDGRRSPASPSAPPPSPPPGLTLDSPITAMRSIGPGLSRRFGRLGVNSIRDALYFFPRRHVDYSQRVPIARLTIGQEQTVVALVWQAQEKLMGGRRGTEAVVGDDTGNLRVVWFNQPYLARQLGPNTRLALSGRVHLFQGHKVLENPEYEFLEEDPIHTGRLVPIYPLTEGLHQRQVRRALKQVVDTWAPQLSDFLPLELRQRHGFRELGDAIRQAHFPKDAEANSEARRRLAFDELFLLQLGILARRRSWQADASAPQLGVKPPQLEAWLRELPFTLTRAQRRALDEVLADIAGPRPMSRLLQGEVGSGKTVVATLALLSAVASGFQGAFMAPTELLAEQHFRSISALLRGPEAQAAGDGPIASYRGLLSRPVTIGLLTGSLKPAEKEEVRSRLAGSSLDIVIGTHALIQREVDFPHLGLLVVDEQHRFGVMQRSALRQKADMSAHLLVMTATPIPRSLALTLYGDLDLSVIDELPPGRQEIATRSLEPEEREEAYQFISQQVAQGRQAFIVCPLIEESPAVDARAAVAEYQRLAWQVFPDLRLGLVHGQMPPRDRDDVMRQFRDGHLHVLVATPVVEVGIDIPNATVMLIEGADRFGLAQLHQFRGRVGRGPYPSHCLLLAEDPSPEARERLRIVEATRNGFQLAEEDLRLRGPGEFFGTRQSGLPDLRLARLSDTPLLELARAEALRLFEVDPELAAPEQQALSAEVARVWRGGPGETPVAEA